MPNFLKQFLRDESGLESVEFAVITALIIGAMVITLAALGGALSDRFGETQDVVSP